MGNRAKALGNAGERGVVERALAAGVPATKQPGSGVYKAHPNDVVLGEWVLGEVKVRTLGVNAAGERTFPLRFEWLVGAIKHAKEQGYHHAALFIRPKGGQKRMVVLEEAVYLGLLAESLRRRGGVS